MTGNEAVVEILKREGVEYLFCFPANTLIDAAAAGGIRPIMTRTERTLVNMADGFSRVSNGERIGVCTVQDGPGVENAFAGVAQAFADSSPILFLPGQAARERWGIRPEFNVEQHYGGVTKWVIRAQRSRPVAGAAAARVYPAQVRTAGPGDGGSLPGCGIRGADGGACVYALPARALGGRPGRCGRGGEGAAVGEGADDPRGAGGALRVRLGGTPGVCGASGGAGGDHAGGQERVSGRSPALGRDGGAYNFRGQPGTFWIKPM